MLAYASQEAPGSSHRRRASHLGEGDPFQQAFVVGAATGAHFARQRRGAQRDATIARQVGVHVNTVINTRTRFAARRTQSVQRAEQTRRKARKLDGQAEAHLVALVCAGPPAGRKTWTMHLLAGRLVEARVVDRVTGETVRQTLKKMRASRG